MSRPSHLSFPRRARALAALGLVALAVPVSGCGSSSNTASASGSGFDPATLVPASAPFYADAVIRPTGAAKADVLTLARKISGSSDPVGQVIKAFDRSAKADGVSFSKDVEPWLGKTAGVAVTGLRDARHPDYVVIIDTTDAKRALATIKKGNHAPVQRSYRGVSYAYDAKDRSAAAAISDALAIGTEGALKAVIDTDKGGTSLASTEKLKAARKNVTQDGRLVFAYADPAAIFGLAAAANPVLGGQAGPLKQLMASNGATAMGAAVTVAADAIRVETAVDGKKHAGPTAAAAKTLAGLPGDSVVGFGFGPVGPRAQQGVKQLGQLGGVAGTVIGQFRAITGLDLQQDVLSWMGKGGLFVRGAGIADLGGALVIDTTDPQKTATFISRIQGLAQRFGSASGLRVTPFQGGGASGFSVKTSQLPFPIIIATGAGKFVIAVGESSLKQALKPTSTLADNAQFKATAAKLGAAPAFYADVKTIVSFAALAAGNDPKFAKAKRYLDAFTGIAAGGRQDGGVSKGAAVIAVK